MVLGSEISVLMHMSEGFFFVLVSFQGIGAHAARTRVADDGGGGNI